jgi:hypothetical protein
MKLRSIALLACVAAVPAFAQTPDFGRDEQLAEMKKLDWMIGEWKGSGTSTMPGRAGTSDVYEKIERRLDGLALLVEGVGRKTEAGKETKVHHALAMLRWAPDCKCYRFPSHTMHGSFVDAEMRIMEDKRVVWGFKTPGGEMRYTIRHTDKGQWNEIGEMSRDGKNWIKHFDMTLDRVK